MINKKNTKKILELENVKIEIPIDEGILKPVQGINFTIEKGKTLGLVGESGCGKSLTSKSILGINPVKCKVTGNVLFDNDGEIINLLEYDRESEKMREIRGGKITMIFQEPMTAFSPMYTIGNQIIETILLHKTKDKKEARKIALDMMKKVGIANAEKRIDQYPFEFSGGMIQRAMIAMALSCEPELIIADEPTTALDVTIQAQVLELMKELQKEFNTAILFITHDLGTVAQMCDDVAVMYLGKIVEKASVKEIFNNPKHPYTKGLLRSIPQLGNKKRTRLESIEGTVPLPLDLPPMCGFYERCENRIEGLCDCNDVPQEKLSEEHYVRCFLYSQHKVKECQHGESSSRS